MSFAYMPLYTGDYLRDTQHLSPCEHGVYVKLLMYCWDQRGPAPLDERKLCGIVNARSGDEIEAMRRVLSEFFVRMVDGFYNRRIQLEIERCEAISGARSEAGKRGYQAKAKQLLNKSRTLAEQVSLSPSPSPSLTPTPIQPATQVRARRTDEAPRIPPCPHLEILKVWTETLPSMPQHSPEDWRGARADHLKARWREKAALKGWQSQDDGLTYFKRLFAYVGQSPFLTGRVQTKGRRPFHVELSWLVTPENWAKVHEGKYHEEAIA